MTFALDPLVSGLRRGRDRRRGAVVRRAASLADDQEPTSEPVSRSKVAAPSARSARCVRADSLVSLQLALSLPLLVGAGLLARTVYNLQRADLGFPAERLLLVRVDLRETGRRRRTPRRRAAASCSARSSRSPACVRRASRSWACSAAASPRPRSKWKATRRRATTTADRRMDAVGPGYFSTLGIPIIAGTRNPRERSRRGAEGLRDQRGVRQAVLRPPQPASACASRRSTTTAADRLSGGGRRAQRAHPGSARRRRAALLRGRRRSRRRPSNSPTFLIRTATDAAPVMAAVRADDPARGPRAADHVRADRLDEQMAPLTAQDRTTAQLAVVFRVRRAHARGHRPVRRAFVRRRAAHR